MSRESLIQQILAQPKNKSSRKELEKLPYGTLFNNLLKLKSEAT